MDPLAGIRQWRRIRQRDKEMQELAETLIGPIREGLDADERQAGTPQSLPDPEDLFQALVESARRWRGERRLEVHRVRIPRKFGATGMWVERTHQDDVIVEADAEIWHQAQILGHELWHMRQKDGLTPEQSAAEACSPLGPGPSHGAQPAAARSSFDEDPEKEAELFGILVGQQMRALMERDVIAGDTARRIADSLGYQRSRR
ncbi:toxin [Streptomyces sp. NPDC048419]|uniref:toxin n=1 Tax=Streptomyces sp. NPDC048419 TaxID=3365547 RepID=UPI003712AE53